MSISIEVQKRDLLGKKVKSLYRDGKVIGNLYGRGKESIPIQADYEPMRKVVEQAGTNHAIEMIVGKDSHLVLIKNIDQAPASGLIRHIEFHMVNRNEKVEAEVPVELVGTAPAVLAGNMIITLADTVLVKANPTNLPDHLEIDAELLKEPEDIATVKDIKLPSNVEMIDEEDTPLFKVEVPRSQIESESEEEISAADVPSEHGTKETEN